MLPFERAPICGGKGPPGAVISYSTLSAGLYHFRFPHVGRAQRISLGTGFLKAGPENDGIQSSWWFAAARDPCSPHVGQLEYVVVPQVRRFNTSDSGL